MTRRSSSLHVVGAGLFVIVAIIIALLPAAAFGQPTAAAIPEIQAATEQSSSPLDDPAPVAFAGECRTTGGCSNFNSNYPSGTFSTTSSSWTTVSAAIYGGEYAYYSVTAGQTYEWTLCPADGGSASYDSQLTLWNQGGTTQYCYSDDYCGDDAYISWTATFSGVVRVLVSQYYCTNNSISSTLRWRSLSGGTTPDLAPYQPAAWNDKIPIGITQLTGPASHTYAGPYNSNQVLYFNWASLNQGTATASSYKVHVEVTGTGGGMWDWPGVTTEPNYYTYLSNDQGVGPLSGGSHTFKVWVDYDGVLSESNESNNYYERTITVETVGPDINVSTNALTIACGEGGAGLSSPEQADATAAGPANGLAQPGQPTQPGPGPAMVNEPLVNDGRDQPPAQMDDYLKNLKAVGLDSANQQVGMLLAQTATGGGFTGNSDSMTGTVAVSVIFVESNGSIDSNQYTWTTAAEDSVLSNINSGLAWWASEAAARNCSLSFQVTSLRHTESSVQQGYEPILHTSGEQSLWIAPIMANLGYSSGDIFARVAAYNTALRIAQGTDWAYTAFVCYNPSPAADRYTDGYSAWAYFGGPFTNLLYRSFAWPFNQVFTHESGHIFNACDEYYQAGYGGCTSCAICANGVANGNCEYCNPGSVNCMMKANSWTLCTYTPGHLGWGSCSVSNNCFTIFNMGSQNLQVTSITRPAWAVLSPAPPYTIGAGGSLEVCVSACDACAGSDLDDVLVINSNDLDEPSVSVTVHVDCPPCSPPAITQPPSGQSVCPGQQACFTVAASGTDLVYQWESAPSSIGSYSPIGGATSPQYCLLAGSGDNGRMFRCNVTNSCGGPVTSNPAMLTVGSSSDDSDCDGINNGLDDCPDTIPGVPVDAHGCPPLIIGDFDRDGDVDLSADFAHFEECASGPDSPIGDPLCWNADLDSDDDADQTDFGAFQVCLSGEDTPASLACYK